MADKPTILQVIRRRREKLMIKRDYISLLVRSLVLVLILILVFTQLFGLVQVSGNDMFPAIRDGDILLYYRLQSSYDKDVVVVYRQDGELTAGRIIGRPGDVIQMDESGSLSVNGTTQAGQILYPTYPKENIIYPYVVPQDHYFILCDYRTQGVDSRDFGAVPASEIQGKVITLLRRRSI